MEQNLVMGFDLSLDRRCQPDRGILAAPAAQDPLVDDEFTGHHPFFWQKSSADGAQIAKTFGAVSSALGKLFGF
jgi:hypothetical protein